MEVSTLSSGITFKSLSISLQNSVRFFHYPLPAFPTASLAVSLPNWRKFGLTVFHVCDTNRLGPAFSPVVLCQRIPKQQRDIQPHTFWSKPISYFGLFLLTTFKQQFTYVSHPIQPSISSTYSWQNLYSSSRMNIPPGEGFHCQSALHQTVTSFALLLDYHWLNNGSATEVKSQLDNHIHGLRHSDEKVNPKGFASLSDSRKESFDRVYSQTP